MKNRIFILGFRDKTYYVGREIISKYLSSLGIHSLPDKLRRFGSTYHTHSAIHEGFYNAAIRIGLEVYWADYYHKFPLIKSDDIIITEPRYIHLIPHNCLAKVILHTDSIYKNESKNIYTLSNYLTTNDYSKYIKINDFFYYNKIKRNISMAWATDISYEIPFIPSKIFKFSHNHYYVDNL